MPERRPEAVGLGRRTLDGLAGAAGLVGGALLLLSGRNRHGQGGLPGAPARHAGDVEFDNTAQAGRGRPSTPPTLKSEHLGHEPLDANAGDVALVMGGLAVSVIVAVFVLLLLLELFHSQLQSSRPALTGEQLANVQPPKPNLVAHPNVYLHNEIGRQERVLNSFAWHDARHTSARIPIARAMALTVGRSLDASP